MNKNTSMVLPVNEDILNALKKLASEINLDPLDLMSLFMEDLTAKLPHTPAQSVAAIWYYSHLPQGRQPLPFVQWLREADQLDTFFFLMETIYFHVDRLLDQTEFESETLRQTAVCEKVYIVLLEYYCGGFLSDQDRQNGVTKAFSPEVLDHLDKLFTTIDTIYNSFVTDEEVDEEDQLITLDVMLAFDVWKRNKLGE